MATADIILDNRGNQRIGVNTLMREKGLIKQVPGARYDGELKCWTTPLSYTACTQLSSVFGKAIQVGPELQAWAANRYNWAILRADMAKSDDATLGHGRESEMSPLQRLGAHFLATDNSVLADEMGSGKTVQASVALELVNRIKSGINLVVCPNAVKRSWAKHVMDWTNCTPFIVKGSATKRRAIIESAKEVPGAVLIMNWEQLRAHSRLAPYGNIRLSDDERTPKELNGIEFLVIIADEAHRAKEPKNKQTRALFALKAERRWALTGTPIANHPGDFWSILHFVDPDEWPSRGAYVDRYCQVQWNAFGGSDIIGVRYDTRAEFYHLVDRYFLRRLKSQIMGREIKKVPEVRYVELSPRHRKMYNEFRDELLLLIEDDVISATNQLAATSRLVQLSAAMLEPLEDGRFTMCEPSPKVDELINLVNDLDGEPLVVYSSSKQLAYLAAARLEKEDVSYLIATGDQGEDERANAVERFQAGEARVFIGTTGAISEGVTLTRAKVLCFLHRDWSMVKNKQAEDRIHRWGQEADEVTIVDIITEETIDERVYDVFVTKQGRLEEITRDKLKELV